MKIAVYPGTFDPITLGHLDIIRRGAHLVDKLVIGVTTNPSKEPMFSVAERMAMVRREVADVDGNVEVVEFDNYNQPVAYGASGRVKLTTLTKEFFVPGFMERDEGEREKPYATYPWDGVSGVKPWRGIASSTTVGVY